MTRRPVDPWADVARISGHTIGSVMHALLRDDKAVCGFRLRFAVVQRGNGKPDCDRCRKILESQNPALAEATRV